MTTSNTAYNAPAPSPAPPTPLPVPPEPPVSVQSQVGMLVIAVLTVLSFIFHKDYSNAVPAVTTCALAVYGAAVSIARALKYRTTAMAVMTHNAQTAEIWLTQQKQQQTYTHDQAAVDFRRVAEHIGEIETRVAALEPKPRAKKTTAKKTTTPTHRRRAPTR